MANKKKSSNKKKVNDTKTKKNATTSKTKNTVKEVNNSKKQEKKNSLWEQLKVTKHSGKYLISKPLIGILCGVGILLFVGGYFVGVNFDIIQTVKDKASEKTQTVIENMLKEDIKDINKSVSEKYALDAKPTYVTSGTVNDYNYLQYIAYTEGGNAYVSWAVDKDSKKIIAVWTAEQHAVADGEDSASLEILYQLINGTYKDLITDKQRAEILSKSATKQMDDYTEDGFAYVQQVALDGLEDENYDWMAVYEIDLFTYVPDDSSSTETTTTEAAE